MNESAYFLISCDRAWPVPGLTVDRGLGLSSERLDHLKAITHTAKYAVHPQSSLLWLTFSLVVSHLDRFATAQASLTSIDHQRVLCEETTSLRGHRLDWYFYRR